jgi:hypothetical protein
MIPTFSKDLLAEFKYLGMTVTNQSCSHEKIRRRLNFGNAYYDSGQNLIIPSPL